MADLAVVIVSYNSAAFLPRCLASVREHAGRCELDIVVVDNGSGDGSAELVGRVAPAARVLVGANRGFAYANNVGLATVEARHVLFLNADTEVLEGSFETLVAALDARPEVGLVGCRQTTPDGALYPTIRRFPSPGRQFWEALGSERFPFRAPWLGERELDPRAYDHETPCDWTSGSFMLARTEAVRAIGGMDERFFLYCEEPDLCLRLRAGGWEIRHLPAMTILHHAGRGGDDPRLAAQEAYARRQYAAKHLAPHRRRLSLAALGLYHARRLACARRGEDGARRAASRAALGVLAGRAPAPFAHLTGPG